MSDTGFKTRTVDIGNYRDKFAYNRGYKFGTDTIDSRLTITNLGNGLGLKSFSSPPSNSFWTYIPGITLNNKKLYRLNEGVAITGKYFYKCYSGLSSIKFSTTYVSSNEEYGAKGRHRFAFFLASGGGGGGSGAEWSATWSAEDTGGSGGSGGAYVGGICSSSDYLMGYSTDYALYCSVGVGGTGGDKSTSGGGKAGSSGEISELYIRRSDYSELGIASAHAYNNGVGGLSDRTTSGIVSTNNSSLTSDNYRHYGELRYIYHNNKLVSNVIRGTSGRGGSNGEVGGGCKTSLISLDTSLYDFASTTNMNGNINATRYPGSLYGGTVGANYGGTGGAGPLGNGGNGTYVVGGSGEVTAGGAGGHSRDKDIGGNAGAGGSGGGGILLILY